MRKQIPLLKKAGAFALSLGLMFTLVSPYAIYAEEEGTVTPQTEETNTQEQVENGKSKADLASARSADITKPVIEKIDFPDNNCTVKAGSKIPIYVSAYDAESEIKLVQVTVQYQAIENDSYSRTYDYELSWNPTNTRFEGFIDAETNGYDSACIVDIMVVDECNNKQNAKVFDEDYNALYQFNITDGVSDTTYVKDVEIKSFIFEQNEQTLDQSNYVNGSIEISEQYGKKIDSIQLTFMNEEIGDYLNFYAYRTIENHNLFEINENFDDIKAGKWILNEITASYYDETENMNYQIDFKYDDMESIFFNVSGENDTEPPVITEVDVDKNGEVLHAGDIVNFKVKAKDNKSLSQQGWIYLQATEDVYDDHDSLQLTYDKEADIYTGSYEITNETYPCEWYISQIDIFDEDNNHANDNLNFHYPYYFLVEKDGTISTPTYNLSVRFYVLNEEGEYQEVSNVEKENVVRRSTFKENGIALPNGATSYMGLNFVGWETSDGDIINEDTQITENQHLAVYAKYDKNPVDIYSKYVDKNKQYKEMINTVLVPEGITYKEVLEQYVENPNDMYDDIEFESWHMYGDLNEKVNLNTSLWLEPKYKDKDIISIIWNYYKENGLLNRDEKLYFIPENSKVAILKDIVSKENPTHFKGLRFKEWKMLGDYGEDATLDNLDSYWIDATYDNCMVRVFINDQALQNTEWIDNDYMYTRVAEKGETITLPSKFGEYEDVKWYLSKGEFTGDFNNRIITVNSDLSFYGYAKLPDVPDEPDTPVTPDQPDEPDTPLTPDTPVEPDKPDTPDTPVTPDKPVTPVEPEKPITPDKEITDTGTSGSTTDKVIVLPKEETNKIVEKIAKADNEEKIEVFMGNATVVPTEVLEAAKGKDVVVELNMGGYTWEINGKDILASNLKDINLEVKMDSNAVPSNIVKELAGDNPVKQLSLTHNGNFGFKADLKINVGNENKGKYGNLYYYDSDGKMVYMNAGKIDENGNVVVSFSHASDYVIVINDKDMAPSTNNKDVIKDTANQAKDLYGFITISLCISGAFMLLYASKKKSEE